MNFTEFNGIIFDLDGTLIKSNHVWSKIDEKFFSKRGIEIPDDYFKIVSVMNFEQAAEYTNTAFHLNENIEDIQKEWYEMAVYEYTNVIEIIPGADKFIHKLKNSGVKIALATASSKELYEPVLKHNGIYDYFDSGCLCLMEWAENIPDLLPDETLHVSIQVAEDGSRVLSWED